MSGRLVDNWLKGFEFYTSESECPENYLFWCGLSAISAALQGKVFTRWGYFPFKPNIYVILIGRSGLRKSTSIRFARNFIRDAGIVQASEAITKEALIQQMKSRATGDNSALSVVVGEFASFIAPSGLRMVEFLTDIYDCDDPWEYTTKGGGTDKIDKPYLTLLGGVVPDWISIEFTEAFSKLGFASRTVFVYEKNLRFRRAFPEVTTDMLDMAARLTHDLEKITEIEGEYLWTKEAHDWFEHWYEVEFPKEELDYRLEGYLERKPTQVIKLSMLLAAAESQELQLEASHFQKAKALLDLLEPSMVDAFSAVGKNPYANDLERIAADIHRQGKMSKGELVKKNTHAMSMPQLEEVMESLVIMGEVVSRLEKGNIIYVSAKT